jgi:hypothetical protein
VPMSCARPMMWPQTPDEARQAASRARGCRGLDIQCAHGEEGQRCTPSPGGSGAGENSSLRSSLYHDGLRWGVTRPRSSVVEATGMSLASARIHFGGRVGVVEPSGA